MAGEKTEQEVYVYDFKYDMKDSTWQAYIAAFGQEEAVQQLYKMMPAGNRIDRITATNQYCRLDAISAPFRDNLTMPFRAEIERLKNEIKVLKGAKDLRTIAKK